MAIDPATASAMRSGRPRLERAVREVAVEADRDAVAGERVEDGRQHDVAPAEPVAPQHDARRGDGEQRDGDEGAERDLLEPGPQPGLGQVLQRTAAVLLDLDGRDGGVRVAGVAAERAGSEGCRGHGGPRVLQVGLTGYGTVTYGAVTAGAGPAAGGGRTRSGRQWLV
jgi:hypothetical protein